MRAWLPRRIRLISTLPLVLTTVLLSGVAGAETITYTAELPAARVRVVSDGTLFSVRLDATAGEYHLLAEPGEPALTFRVVRVLLPQGREVDSFDAVRVAGLSAVVSESFRPILAAAPRDPREFDESQQAPAGTVVPDGLVEPPDGGPFPTRVARYLGTGYLHGHAIASFAVFPFQVDGERLVLHERIELTVTTRASSGATELARPQRMSSARAREIHNQIDELVANPPLAFGLDAAVAAPSRGRFDPAPAPSLEGSVVEYLIVTVDSLAASYQRLADWKTAKGVPTVIRTLEWIHANNRRGVDIQETLRFFIKDAYEKWGVKWVLLGGDTQDIPTRYCYNTYYYGGRYIPVDLYYAGLDGSWNADHDDVWGESYSSGTPDNADLYAEVIVGRLPTSSTTDVDILVDKIINYTTPVDPSYTDKMMWLAEVLFPYPWNPGQDIDVNGADTAEYVIQVNPEVNVMDIVRAYETEYLYPGAIHESRQQAIDSLDAGFNLVYHVGHGYRFNMHVGDVNVVISDADALTNQDRFSNMYLLNCTAVAFDFDCLGEHFLKNPNGGAVSIVGSSESAFPDASIHYMNEYTRLLFAENVIHIGDAYTRSRLPRTPFAEFADNPDRWTHFIYTILADPELPLWTGAVDTLQVVHADSVGMGVNSLQVDVTASGAPAESVLVCLWKATDDYQYELTDAAGSVTFDFTCESPGTVSVVATGRNHSRYQGSITVGAESGAYLSFAGLTVNDATALWTEGNGDGIIDAGETIEFTPLLYNTGQTQSGWALLTLRSNDPLVTVTDSLSAIGPVQPGETTTAVDVWSVEFAAGASDESAVDFTVFATEPGGDWTDSFTRLIHAPRLEFVTLIKDDSPPHGNGNGILENGEEFLLFCSLKNYGTGAASGLVAVASDVGGGVVVVDSADTYPEIVPFAEELNVAGFRLSETNTAVENPLAVTVTDAYGRILADTVELREPSPPSNLLFDTSLGQDRIHMWWTPSASADVDRYRVYRATSPGGPYAIASADLVDHANFTDMALAASTRYYFKTAAVDASGNESPASAEFTASTTPPQLSGWPNVLAAESSNSPAVGDIDGDGDLEVVVGNDVMYAWHHDGVEVRDGDSNLQSWGVFSDQGSDFVGPAALARLDGKPGLEIVAAAYTSKEVFCFDYTGAVLPGWPQPTTYEVRAGVVVGDLDGDNDFEIIAIDQDAIMYAWHHDGNEVIDGDGNPGTSGVFRRFPDVSATHYQMPAVCDVDDDGADEIIIGTQDSTLYAIGGDGNDLPGWPVTIDNTAGGGVAVGDVDDDGALEIVCTVRNTSSLILYELDGSLVWSRYVHQNLFFNPSPSLADLTGDGKLEIIYPGSNGKLQVKLYNGNNLPGFPVTYSATTYTESSPVVADVSGDGLPDVLVGDEGKLINAWDASGSMIDGFPLATQNAVRGTPAVVDFDGDGDVDVVGVSFDRKVYAWDAAVPYDETASLWPEYKANSHRNACVGYEVPSPVEDGRAPSTVARLGQNIPNPFNPVTTIAFQVPDGTPLRVSLVVYDVTGARIKTLANGPMAAGLHSRRWEGTDERGNRVSTGVYFYRLEMPGFADTKKMVLLK
jgi:hypothetical protein